MFFKNLKVFFAAMLLTGSCLQCPCEGRNNVILASKDFTVTSFEFGRFPDGHSPTDHRKGSIIFQPLKKPIANKVGYWYGYRIGLRSQNSALRVLNFPTVIPPIAAKGKGDLINITKGVIYQDWPIDGVGNGDYVVHVWLNDVPLQPLRYMIDFR